MKQFPYYNPLTMPELPEVQRVRQTLASHILGKRVINVQINRPDIITGLSTPHALLVNQTIHAIQRHGKQLALCTFNPQTHPNHPSDDMDTHPCLCVHLGMTGSLRYHPPKNPRKSLTSPDPLTAKHVHIVWTLDDQSHITFTDPRRFGGVWSFPNFHTLQTLRWSRLGPDALTITPKQLHAKLQKTQRPIKAALLDQATVAGLGNIYVDEALFGVAIHPMTSGSAIPQEAVTRLVRAFKAILRRAIASGGSTIRSYSDGEGNAGTFQHTLKVYGRAGQPCVNCRRVLISTTIIGRTTTLCQYCQRGSELA